ncbi:MAG: hypothetical protein MI923_21930, partial [Phycisphaerales bacterium]|nr:hypothetical protein [Phycisphaerales bacterium]
EVRYIEVLFHTFCCNFGLAEENLSLRRGRRYIEPVGKKTGDSGNGTACRQVPIDVTESLSHFAWRSTPKKTT